MVNAMDPVQTQIFDRIRRGAGDGVFTPKDFLDLGGRDAVDQALTRLVRQGVILRIGRGLYHRPRINKRLGISVPPDPDAIANALGRQTGSRVVPSGAAAANRLGLSTQVPSQLIYLTDGASRKVKVGNRLFHLRHVSARRMPDGDSVADLALRAVRDLGPDGMDDRAVDTLRRRLSRDQRGAFLRQARYADGWIADVARRVAVAEVRGPNRG